MQYSENHSILLKFLGCFPFLHPYNNHPTAPSTNPITPPISICPDPPLLLELLAATLAALVVVGAFVVDTETEAPVTLPLVEVAVEDTVEGEEIVVEEEKEVEAGPGAVVDAGVEEGEVRPMVEE